MILEAKKIVHFRFDSEQHSFELVKSSYEQLNKELGDRYTVLFTPYDVVFEDENNVALLIDGREYTHRELEEVLDKAAMYDDLCK